MGVGSIEQVSEVLEQLDEQEQAQFLAACLDLFPPMVDEEERIRERDEVRKQMASMAARIQERMVRSMLSGNYPVHGFSGP